jgi:GT2 family glycosyltransferase
MIKRISVVIPTYNRKNYLSRLLAQLKKQVLSNVEMSIIAVVDGSTDGTLEMLESEFPEVSVVHGNGHWWWTKSINEGCKFALKKESHALLLMNDHAEIHEKYMETLLNGAEQQPGAIIGSLNISRTIPHKIYFSGVKHIIWWKAKSVRHHNIFSPHENHLTGLHPSILLMGRGMLIPAPVFKKIGFFDEKSFPQYQADLDFVLTAHENNIKTFISWDSIVYSHLELTGKGVTYKKQSFFAFLKSFFQENSIIIADQAGDFKKEILNIIRGNHPGYYKTLTEKAHQIAFKKYSFEVNRIRIERNLNRFL